MISKTFEINSSKSKANFSKPFCNTSGKASFFTGGKRNKSSLSKSSFIQPKLKIGQPNDTYEQEADAMADKIMQASQTNTAVQRMCEDCEEEDIQMKPLKQSNTPLAQPKHKNGNIHATDTITSQLSQTKGSGFKLPHATNQQMRSAFGVDFSKVNIHTDSKAEQMNQSLRARAFTHGNDIYFNKGEYSPNSSAGKHLLAHELTHVVQQKGDMIQRQENTTQSAEESMSDPDLWCADLIELVEYERRNGRLSTIMEYNPVNNDLLPGLNHDIPSIYGIVDVDWMLRLSYSQVGTIIPSLISPALAEGMGIISSHVNYFAAKTFWNTLRSTSDQYELEYGSILQEANLNAPSVITSWIHGNETLTEIFAAALEVCGEE